MAVSNSLTKANTKVGIATYLSNDDVKKQIDSIIGGKNGTRFITSIVSSVNANALIQECTNSSIVNAALLGESLNLSPSPQLGMYYMVPYNTKVERKNEDGKIVKVDVKMAQFQLGYKGYIQLAIRSGQYKKLNVLAIKEGELVKFDPLNEDIEVNLIQDEEARERAKTIGYYAMFEYTNGFRKAIYWSKAKMEAHADRYSKAFNLDTYRKIQAGKISENDMWKYSSFWYKDFDSMAYKTMLRQLISKWGVMSTDFEKAYESDMAVINNDMSTTYVDNDDSVIDVPAQVIEEEVKPEKKAADLSEDTDAIAAALFK